MTEESLDSDLSSAAWKSSVTAAIAATLVAIVAMWQGESFTITLPIVGTMDDSVLSFTLSGFAAGWAAKYACTRVLIKLAQPRTAFLALSAVVLFLSLIWPLAVQPSLGAWIWFNVAHLVVAAIVMHYFFWALPSSAHQIDSDEYTD